MTMNPSLLRYWKWFFRGIDDKPGYRKIVNRWIFLHLGIGLGLASVAKMDIAAIGGTALLPLAGVLVGLSFAWAGNALTLMQTSEIEKLAENRKGGLPEYVYTFQTAILVIMVCLICWGLACLGVFDTMFPKTLDGGLSRTIGNDMGNFVIKTALFALSSLALRECWHVVLGSQLLLIIRREIKRNNAKDPENGGK